MANSDKNILITPNIGATTGTYPSIVFTGANNTPITLRVLDPGTLSFQGTAGELFAIADGLTGTLFQVNDISGIPLMSVASTGNVTMNTVAGFTGIGPRTSEARLHVSTNGPTAEVAYFDRFLTDTLPAIVRIRKARGTAASPTIVASGDEVGRYIFSGYDGTDFRPLSFISSAVDNTPGLNDMPGRMTFHTTPDGSNSPLERMRITNAGDIGIGGVPSAFGGTNLHVLSGTASQYGSLLVQSGTRVFQVLTNDTSQILVFGSRSNHSLGFTTNDSTRMTLDINGNLGIGITSPVLNASGRFIHIDAPAAQAAALHLTKTDQGNTGPDGLIVALWTDGHSYLYNYEQTDLRLGTGNAERFRLDSNQNAKFYSSLYETVTVSATAASATTINYDIITNKNVLYYTVNSTGNWTLNVRGNLSVSLNTMLEVGQAVTIVFLVTNGATPYYPVGFQIDGSTTGVTLEWQGGFAPASGNANSIDAYRYTIIKTGIGATPLYTVLASQTRFA